MVLRNGWLLLWCSAALVSIAFALYFALWSSEQASLDFQWDAARVLFHRTNPYTLALDGQDPQLLPDIFAPNQFPSVLMLLWGYVLLPWTVAKSAWVFSNMLFTVVIVLLLRRLYAPTLTKTTTLLIGALWVSGYTWRLHMGLGQHTLFSLCFFLLSLLALRRKQAGVAGVLLAVALFKYSTVLPLCLIFVQRRAWKPLAIAGGFHVVLHFFAAWWVEESPLALLIQPVLVAQQLTTQGSLDIFALLHTTDFLARVGLDAYATFLSIGIATIFIGTAFLAGRRMDATNVQRELSYLALLVVLSNILVYHRLYDFVTLIIPLFWAITHWRSLPKMLVGVVVAVFVLLNFVHPVVEWATTEMSFPPDMLTLYLYSLIALYYGALLLLFGTWYQGCKSFSHSHCQSPL